MGLRHRVQKIMRAMDLEPSPPQSKMRVETKTAAYTCLDRDSGTLFVAGTNDVTFTLPAVSITGWHAWFCNVTDNEMLILAPAAGTIIAFNDLAANSVSYTTAGDQIGGSFYVVSTGTKWLVMPLHYGDGVLVQTIGIVT